MAGGLWIHAPGVNVHVCVASAQLPVRLNTPLALVASDPATGKKSAVAAMGHASTMIRRPVGTDTHVYVPSNVRLEGRTVTERSAVGAVVVAAHTTAAKETAGAGAVVGRTGVRAGWGGAGQAVYSQRAKRPTRTVTHARRDSIAHRSSLMG
jgi:hypothetical protein